MINSELHNSILLLNLEVPFYDIPSSPKKSENIKNEDMTRTNNKQDLKSHWSKTVV